MSFAVKMAVPTKAARRTDRGRVPAFVLSAAALCGAEIAATLARRQPYWPFV